jgi:flagellar L-ring protein precursor FlgH
MQQQEQTMSYSKIIGYSTLTGILIGLAGCRTLDRVMDVNEAPPVSHIVNPVSHPNYRPVTMPMPEAIAEEPQSNSLWKPGAKTFFKDQRAKTIGDILTITINMNDTAKIENKTNTSRDSQQKIGMNNFLGVETDLGQYLSEAVDPTKLVGLNSKPTMAGAGKVERTEQIQFKLAATITQVLPNGNFVVSGRQEMRINYEVRELAIVGIVRPEDISSANIVPYEKIAEARMSYGGRGQIDDMQQAPWGHQLLNAISPL